MFHPVVLRIFLFLMFALHCRPGIAQEEPQVIKVKKESNLVKAVFDNTDLRLMAVDRFGNPRENKIVTYKLYVKSKKETRVFNGSNNALNGEMINYLNKLPSATKLFFTEIMVEDDDGHFLKLPDVVETWFPDCMNCEKGSKKRK